LTSKSMKRRKEICRVSRTKHINMIKQLINRLNS